MSEKYAIAIDIGTSGIRAQTLDINTSKVISTTITLRHPLPGANVMDHLHFALKVGLDTAHNLIIEAVNKVIKGLNVDVRKVVRVSVCGNPIQLSLFHNIEIRDLVYWGQNAIKRLKIDPPLRNATIISSKDIGLEINENVDVCIPPAIRHEIGADALAMLYKTNVLDKNGIYLVIDFGTNAEIALVIDGEVYACSAAAGPAIEGQTIKNGRLASPGAICDIKTTDLGWKMVVLDENLIAKHEKTIDPFNGRIISNSLNDELNSDKVDNSELNENKLDSNEINVDYSNNMASGITGTGVIAAFSLGIDTGLISDSKIKSKDHRIHLQDNVYITEEDIVNIGKALGAFRAAFLTLAEKVDILLDEIDKVYMAGASGFYVDPLKSLNIGQIPSSSKKIYQVGNTSLEMAKDIALNPDLLNDLQEIADKMRSNHIMLATSKTFEKIYSLELSIYEQGMPIWLYNQWLDKYGFQKLPSKEPNPEIHRIFERDIAELGINGLNIVEIGSVLEAEFKGCTSCLLCVKNCPENALSVEDGGLKLRTDLCVGLACQRCALSCPDKIFDYSKFLK